MKNIFSAAFLLLALSLSAQNRNVGLMSNYYPGTKLSGIWGHVDKTGREYALLGLVDGSLGIVDVTDGTAPVEVFRSPGTKSNWREIKTYKNVAYVSTEANTGLQIVDMSGLPENHNLPYKFFTDNNRFGSVHTVWVDEDGLLYVWGSNATSSKRGYLVYDLKSDPLNPQFYYSFDCPYVHDGFVKGNRMFLSHIYDGYFSMYDVTNKKAPKFLGSQATPNQFTHNTWPTDDGKYLLTTDEKTDTWLTSYNISDPSNITEADRIKTRPGSSSIVHNTHVKGDYAITSWYTEGIVIHDITDPENLIEVGKYDCSTFNTPTFNGVWEVYPFLPSGKIIAGDIEGGLFVFQPVYVKGCSINGTVRDSETGALLQNAQVDIVGTTITSVTKINGVYKTGIATAGTYAIMVSKPGYEPQVIAQLQLGNGETVIRDINLRPLGSGINTLESSGYSVFPNPMSNVFRITATPGAKPAASVSITDLSGKLIMSGIQVGSDVSVEAEKGIYFLQMKFEDGSVLSTKLVKY